MKNVAAIGMLALSCAAGNAAAAENTDLRVGGKIRPNVCDVSLESYTGGNNVDYGVIDIKKLITDEAGNGQLLDAGVTVSVSCGGPTLVGLTVRDGRAGSVPTGFDKAIAEDYVGITTVAGAAFGLGTTQDGGNIGGYLLHLAPQFGSILVGTEETTMVRSDDNGRTWVGLVPRGNNDATRVMMPTGSRIHSWTTLTRQAVGTAPAAVTTASARYEIFSVILSKDKLPLSGEIAIDGQATFTLVYL